MYFIYTPKDMILDIENFLNNMVLENQPHTKKNILYILYSMSWRIIVMLR